MILQVVSLPAVLASVFTQVLLSLLLLSFSFSLLSLLSLLLLLLLLLLPFSFSLLSSVFTQVNTGSALGGVTGIAGDPDLGLTFWVLTVIGVTATAGITIYSGRVYELQSKCQNILEFSIENAEMMENFP